MTAVDTAQARVDAARAADQYAARVLQDKERRFPYVPAYEIDQYRAAKQETYAELQAALDALRDAGGAS